MSGTLFDRLVAAFVFVYALVVYLLTMAETTPFWDSGEFIAIANGLQVSHPPGAPFYMIVGRFFGMAAPLFSAFSPEPVAFAINLVSVLCAAATILLTHLVIVRLVRVWAGEPATWTWTERLAANAGGAIGALAFAVTDSFWFNAVEAEVYAMSMLFTALVVWLALVWRDATRVEEAAYAARGEHPFGLKADRYLLAIAYLFGLAIGVHLLNVLTLFFIALVIYFQKVERPGATAGQRLAGIAATGAVSAALFFVIYPGIVQILPDLAGRSGAPTLFLVAVTALLVGLVWWTQRAGRPILNLLALTVTLVMVGYSSYALIFIRSAADPPIDENDPETAEAIVSYLKREQYGSTPLLTGASYNDRTGEVSTQKSFPRRHSTVPQHIQEYARYSSDADFFWSYQVGHMYWRYFMWQFVGKAADTQDAGWISGIGGKGDLASLTPSERAGRNAYYGLPLLLGLLGLLFHFQRDWRRAFAVLVLFIVTGLGIIVYLNQTPFQPRERDYSYVASFFAFSLWIGIGATGLLELVADLFRGSPADGGPDAAGGGPDADDAPRPDVARAPRTPSTAALAAIGVLLFLAVPGWMTVENYDDHDRSGRRIATDFARNLLESTAPNAILFTNGDNDTFPLWYLQEVMGIRRDVRVVNLSLLNTEWYIRQLKNQPSRESAPVPFTVTDDEIAQLGNTTNGQPDPRGPLAPALWEPRDVALPVDASSFTDETLAGRVDPDAVPDQMRWRLDGRPLGPNNAILYTADLAVLDILNAVAADGWKRPVYIASTVGAESELGLVPFFQNEGLARRIVPIERPGNSPDGAVVPEIIAERLANFQFRGLADPSVYHDENARNMADGYRSRLGSIAAELGEQGRQDEARALLATLEEQVPAETIPVGFGSLYTLSEAYRAAGDRGRMLAILKRAEDIALAELARASDPAAQDRAFQYVQFVQTAYVLGDAYDEASALMGRIADFAGDPTLRQTPDEIRASAERMRAEQGLAPADTAR